MLTGTDEIFISIGLGLTAQLQAAGIKISRPAAFAPGQIKPLTLRNIRKFGLRVIFLLAFAVDVHDIFMHAQGQAMTAAG